MSESQPLVSVLLPVRNEALYIKQCLQAVFDQTYPIDKIEILIADGMSTDSTRELILKLMQHDNRIKIFDNFGKIVPIGLNILIPEAKGDVIIRVDGHTRIAPDYVNQCVLALSVSGADNVGGRMIAMGSNPFGEAVAVATSIPFGIGGGRFHHSEKMEWVDTVYMGAWYKDLFRKIGLFDEELVRDQDDEFNYRLRALGGKILLSPLIKSVYSVRSKPRTLWKQYFQYGFWKVRVLQKHPRQMSLRQFIPPLFVLSIWLAFLLTLFLSWGWLFLVGLLGAYLLANLSASYLAAKGKNFRTFCLLPPTFTIIHISYGLGFLLGLIKLWNRWKDKIGKVPVLN